MLIFQRLGKGVKSIEVNEKHETKSRVSKRKESLEYYFKVVEFFYVSATGVAHAVSPACDATVLVF